MARIGCRISTIINMGALGWIKTWKWRILLSVVSVLLSVGMSPWFYNGLLAYSPNLHFFIKSIDLVPTDLSNALAKYQISHQLLYWTKGRWVRFLFWEHQLLVFFFWWWIGWKVDRKAASRSCPRACTIAEIILGLALSIMLFKDRAAEPIYPYRNAAQWIMIAWSAALLCYSLLRFSQLSGMRRQPAR